MGFNKFDLLLSNKLSDLQISELVLEAENDSFLKQAIDGYLVEHILDDSKGITRQLELLAKPLSWHQKVIEDSIRSSGASKLPINDQREQGKLIKAIFGVATTAIAASLLIFFLSPFNRENTQPIAQIKSVDNKRTDTIRAVTNELTAVPSKTATGANGKYKTAPTENDAPQVNDPIMPAKYAQMGMVQTNATNATILASLLSARELALIDTIKIKRINEVENLKIFSFDTSNNGQTYIGTMLLGSGVQKSVFLRKEKRGELLNMIKKYAQPVSITPLTSSVHFILDPRYNQVITVTGVGLQLDQNHYPDTIHFKMILKTGNPLVEDASDSVLYYSAGK